MLGLTRRFPLPCLLMIGTFAMGQATPAAPAKTAPAAAAADAPKTPETKTAWVMQTSGTTASLRGIHALAGGAAWASGTGGTVLRTLDGGSSWQVCAVPKGAEKLDFRGVWAWDAQTAVVMSSGPGDASRIYETSDGCQSWTLLATNTFKDGFWDSIAFFDRQNGRLLGDPVDGRFQFFDIELSHIFSHKTAKLDLWRSPGLKADAAAEGAFAASNSSLCCADSGISMFGTGGKGGAYLYRSTGTIICFHECSEQEMLHDRDKTEWTKVSVPLAGGSAGSGVFSVGLRDRNLVVAVGGDYEKPAETAGTAAFSNDGGKTWTAAAVPPHGYRSAVAYDPKLRVWIAVGTNGGDFSRDDGKTWQPLDDGNWNALSLPYVVGNKGRIAVLADGAIPAK